jgi:transposase
MFTRTKKDPRTGATYVQLVESYREAGQMKQRVIRHIGTAKSDESLAHLKHLADIVKVELEHHLLKQQIILPEVDDVKKLKTQPIAHNEKISLTHAQACKSMILGIHDIYGFIYDLIGFNKAFPTSRRNAKAVKLLREMVLARIAIPGSKRASVNTLANQFGVDLKLDNVYQMMDKLNDVFCENIQKQALAIALNLTHEKLKVLFYDATTLYFESFIEDDLKQNGYSKDMKFNQSQILFALFVTDKGLPIGYEIFPGATFEGHTLIPILEKLKTRYHIKDVVFVADRGMLSKNNLDYLDKNHFHYIVGARLKSLSQYEQQKIIAWCGQLNKELTVDEVTERIKLNASQTLILSYKPSRAKKDRADREKAIQKLQSRLKRSKNPKQLISRYGFQKFISVLGEAHLEIDEVKLASEAIWDGVTGILTNHPILENQQILANYRGLWQVEESFRISKHDLKIRPIFHWTPRRIKAHMAIAFMAFVCVRYLEYRVNLETEKLSPEQIRQSLMSVQATVIRDTQSIKDYLFLLPINHCAKQIYRTLGIKVPSNVSRLKLNQQ